MLSDCCEENPLHPDLAPFFSIIIPTFNRRDYLREALASVFKQQYTDYEVIVVDDGSTEDLSSVIDEYRERVRFIRQENAGPGVARNRGAQDARGEYLAFLDNDDVWLPWTLSAYVDAIEANRRPALLAGRLLYFTDESEMKSIVSQAPVWQAYTDFYASGRHGLYCGSGQMVVRRDVFLDAGGFTDRRINAEDHDFVMRMGTAPGFVRITQPMMIGYRQHRGSMTGNAAKTLEGIRYLLQQEREGRYPGGRERRSDRRRILSHHARPVSIEALRQGDRGEAWSLYRATLGWNLRFCRLRYLAGFAAIAAQTRFRRAI